MASLLKYGIFVLGFSSLQLFTPALANATTPSLSGANIPLSTQLIDASLNTWTLVSGVVYENGKMAGKSSGVTFLLYDNKVIYQKNSAGNFWSWTGTAWSDEVPDPRVVSASGTKIPTVSQIVDAQKNIWVVSGGVVYENGLAAGFTAQVVALYLINGTIYQQNSLGNFYKWNGTSWPSCPSPIASPSPTPSPTPTIVVTPQTGIHVALDDMEVFNPFSSWANAKTTYGAKGDGVTDDAPALQKALNDLGQNGKASVLYLPAGTYLIKSTLNVTAPTTYIGDLGVSIVGDSPTTTILKWGGPSGGAMFLQNGGFNTSYSRMTLDGQKTAGFGIAQWWNTTSGTPYAGSSEHVDMIIQDVNIGIMGGSMGADYGQLDSEGQVRRVTFLRNTYAGVDTGSWNALDWWVIDSQFIDCARGLSNIYGGPSSTNTTNTIGAGAFYVYRSYFQGSTVADIAIANVGWFSMHDNVSVGSAQFFNSSTGEGGNAAAIIIEGNRIVNTTNPVSISNGNMGALTLIDNEIRSLSATASPVALNPEYDANFGDIVSIGNKYTVPAADYFSHPASGDRIVSIDDQTVATSSISAAALTIPSTPSRVARTVFEVPANATQAQIQTAINNAVAAANAGAVNPIVHLPPGTYNISSSLTIPAKARIQVVGDALTTNLNWTGPKGGFFFSLAGPSYATLRNMYVFADNQYAGFLTMSNADQSGGRVLIEGSRTSIMTASNVTQTQISAQLNTGFSGLNFSNVQNFVAVGSGGMGPVSSTDGSNITILDTWYEGTASELYRQDSGSLTLMGAQLNPATHSPPIQPIVPAVDLSGLNGLASFIGINWTCSVEPNGICIEIGAETTNTNAMFLGMNGDLPSYFDRTSSGGNVGLISSRRDLTLNGHSVQYPNQGNTSATFINKMLGQVRGLVWDTAPYTPPLGATNVHIYRVDSTNTTGVSITGN